MNVTPLPDMLTIINYEAVNTRAATIMPVTVTQKADDSNNKLQDTVHLLADVFKEVVVDLRKGFHLFAKFHDAL